MECKSEMYVGFPSPEGRYVIARRRKPRFGNHPPRVCSSEGATFGASFATDHFEKHSQIEDIRRLPLAPLPGVKIRRNESAAGRDDDREPGLAYHEICRVNVTA